MTKLSIITLLLLLTGCSIFTPCREVREECDSDIAPLIRCGIQHPICYIGHDSPNK